MGLGGRDLLSALTPSNISVTVLVAVAYGAVPPAAVGATGERVAAGLVIAPN